MRWKVVGLSKTEPLNPLWAKLGLDLFGVDTVNDLEDSVVTGSFDFAVCPTTAIGPLPLSESLAIVALVPNEALAAQTGENDDLLTSHEVVFARADRFDILEFAREFDVRRRWGRVTIAGAGPGDPSLITIKAAAALKEADVVFHDALANPILIEDLKAEKVFVGKRKGKHASSQDQINRMLVDAAREGKTVVRLKGGDPLVFGRGSEESDFLEKAFVEFEFIPGISAAMAAASYAQIPLTERLISSSVAFGSGFPMEKIAALGADTRVYFMANSNLPLIVSTNRAVGLPDSTPAALVHNASLPDQRVWYTTLGELAARPDDEYPTPVLLVLGDVVQKNRLLGGWFQRKSVAWYTGAAPQDESLREYFASKGRPLPRLWHRPLVELRPIEDESEIDRCLDALSSYTWAVFTSRWTIKFLKSHLERKGLDGRAWARTKIAAIGKTTARDLAELGLRADLVARTSQVSGLLDDLGRELSAVAKIFLPSSDAAGADLAEGLANAGHDVDRVAVFRSIRPETAPEVDLSIVEEIVFTSAATVQHYFEFYGAPPATIRVTCVGSQAESTFERLKRTERP